MARSCNCGTPEQVVLSPATAYVSEFSRAVPRAKVTPVTSAMVAGEVAEGPDVDAARTVAEAAPAFLDGAAAVRVVDGQGRALGVLRRDAVIRLMLEG